MAMLLAAPMATLQGYLTFNLDDHNSLPFIDLITNIGSNTTRIHKYTFLTRQNILDICPLVFSTPLPPLNPDPVNPDHIKTMCTIYRYVMIRLYCFFQSSALGLGGVRPNGAPITLPDDIMFVSGTDTGSIPRKDFFKFINDGFILRMDLERMGKPGEVISRRNTIPPGFYNVLLNNVKKNDYKPYGRHILGNVIKNFVIGNVVPTAQPSGPSIDYVFACTQRDHIDVHEDYIYNFVNLISNVEYDASGKKVYSFGIGYILSPGNTGCAVNVCAFIGIFVLAMILYILREHSSYFTSSNGTNESMILNTYSLLNTCNMVSGPTGSNFATTNNMYLYKFTLDTSSQTNNAVTIGGSGQPGTGGIPFQPYSPADPRLQLNPTFLDPVINEIKKLALQTVQAQIQLWGLSSDPPPYTSIIKVLGRFLPKYDPAKNNGIPEYKHLWGHCYGIYIHIIKKTHNHNLSDLLSKYGITSIPDPNIIDVPPSDYCFLISIAEPYFSRGLISYEPTFNQPNKFKVPYLQLHKPYTDHFSTQISISDSGDCNSLYLPIKLLDTLTLRTLLDLQFYSDCRCYTSIEFQFVLNKPHISKRDIRVNTEKTIAIVSYNNLLLVHSTCSGFSNLSVNSEYVTPEIRLKERMDHLDTFRNAAKALIFSQKWSKYVLMKKNSPPVVAKIDENLELVTPDIINVNTEINENDNIITAGMNFQQIVASVTLDSLRTIISMIGSFNKAVSDTFKAAGYISIACSVDALKPGELISINDYDNFYNYKVEDDETQTGGGNKITNMKGGTKFNVDEFNELITEVELSGKVNLLIYIFSCSDMVRELKELLKLYNYYLDNKSIDEQPIDEQNVTLFLNKYIGDELYERLFILYNCVLKYEEYLLVTNGVVDGAVVPDITVVFHRNRSNTISNEDIIEYYKRISTQLTQPTPIADPQIIGIFLPGNQIQIIESGMFQELPDLYIGLPPDMQKQLIEQIKDEFPQLPYNIIKGIYFALDSSLHTTTFELYIMGLLREKQDQIVSSESSESFQELPDLYIGLPDETQIHLIRQIEGRFRELPYNIIKGIYFALNSNLQNQDILKQSLPVSQAKLLASNDGLELVNLYIGLPAETQLDLIKQIESMFYQLKPVIKKGIIEELDETVIQILKDNQIFQNYYFLNEIGKSIIENKSEVTIIKSEVTIIGQRNTKHVYTLHDAFLEFLKLPNSQELQIFNVEEYKNIMESIPSITPIDQMSPAKQNIKFLIDRQAEIIAEIKSEEKIDTNKILQNLLQDIYNKQKGLRVEDELLIFKHLDTEIQEYLLPHLENLQLHIAKLEQSKIITETQKYAKLVELYSTLKPNIQEKLLEQLFTLHSSVDPKIIIKGIYSELDVELQKKIINSYTEKDLSFASLLIKYSQFKGIRELKGIHPKEPESQAMELKATEAPEETDLQAMEPRSNGPTGRPLNLLFPNMSATSMAKNSPGKPSGRRGGTRRKHHNKKKTIKRKKNRKTYKKRLHKNRKRRTHKG